MSLLSHVQSFQIDAPTDRIVAGVPIELLAAPTEILDISDVEVVTGPVDLTVVLKHVELPPEAGVTPWPPDATATSVVTNITSGLVSSPAAGSIEGWLASISGTVPVGTRDISGQIQIDLEWRFTDPRTGAPLGDVAVIGGGLTASAVTIVVPPVLTELTTADFDNALTTVPVTRRIGVQLAVRGRVGTTQDTGEVLVPDPPLELDIVPIPLPSVAALFRNEELAGNAVLLMVPDGSPFSTTSTLLGALSPLRNLLNTVNTAAVATTWATGTRGLYSAISALANRIPLTKHLGFQERDAHNNLGKYNFIERNNWFDTDIEDRGSSALVVATNRTISFFQHDDFRGHELTLNAMPMGTDRLGGAVVRTLHVTVPESEPPGCVSTTGAPGGGWGDKISSYRWSPVVGAP